jgi:hypothetical protein
MNPKFEIPIIQTLMNPLKVIQSIYSHSTGACARLNPVDGIQEFQYILDAGSSPS